jgi:hypothetical protein
MNPSHFQSRSVYKFIYEVIVENVKNGYCVVCEPETMRLPSCENTTDVIEPVCP